jgi:hypothetical protein
MLRWAGGGGLVRGAEGRGAWGRLRASGIPVVGWGLIELELRDGLRGLIELELRDGLRSREVEGRGLVEVEFGLGRTPSGGHAGGSMRQVEMEEDALQGGGEGDKRDDPHLSTACGAQKREHFVDAGQ